MLRCGRAAPEFEGRGLMKLLFRHVVRWAIGSGVESIVSVVGEVNDWSEKSGVAAKIMYTWRWTEVTFTPDRQRCVMILGILWITETGPARNKIGCTTTERV